MNKYNIILTALLALCLVLLMASHANILIDALLKLSGVGVGAFTYFLRLRWERQGKVEPISEED